MVRGDLEVLKDWCYEAVSFSSVQSFMKAYIQHLRQLITKESKFVIFSFFLMSV